MFAVKKILRGVFVFFLAAFLFLITVSSVLARGIIKVKSLLILQKRTSLFRICT